MAPSAINYETCFRLLSFLTYNNTKVHPVLLLLTSLRIQLTVGYWLCLCLHHDLSLVLRDDLFIYLFRYRADFLRGCGLYGKLHSAVWCTGTTWHCHDFGMQRPWTESHFNAKEKLTKIYNSQSVTPRTAI